MDRNVSAFDVLAVSAVSLSARRAWIEISIPASAAILVFTVALRKESVDRNVIRPVYKAGDIVALRKESVDRNRMTLSMYPQKSGRSPQGERG